MLPRPRQIDSWRAAEENAADWMRYWGYSDASVTPGGPDAGIDVRSTNALAQVKWEAAQTGTPALQLLVGARRDDHTKALLFFSGAGYSTPAVDYADDMDIALFKYDLDGTTRPASLAAHRILLRHERETPPVDHRRLNTHPHHTRPAPDASKRRAPGRGWLGRNWALLVAGWFWLATLVDGLAALRGEPRAGSEWWEILVALCAGIAFTTLWVRSAEKRARWKAQRDSTATPAQPTRPVGDPTA